MRCAEMCKIGDAEMNENLTDMERQVAAAIEVAMRDNYPKLANTWGTVMPMLLAKAAMNAMRSVPLSWYEGGNMLACALSAAQWRRMLEVFSPPQTEPDPTSAQTIPPSPT